jgi:hypothetical protein
MMLHVGDTVRMVDRYAQRRPCTCKAPEPSWFDGMRGKVTKVDPLMVHLDGERLPMRFDERDIVRDDEKPTEPNMSDEISMTGAE